MNNPLFAGIDISSKKNKAVFLNSQGERIANFKSFAFENNRQGAEHFSSTLAKIIKEGAFDSVSIGLESTGIYSWHLEYFLLNHSELKPFQPRVYCFNPNLIKGFKKAYPELPKTDDVDAFVIADRLRFGRVPVACSRLNPKYLPLQRLTRFRYHLMHSIVREKAAFLNHLWLKFSCFSQEKPFSNTFGKTSTAVITEFSTDELVSMNLEELVSLLIRKGKNRFPDPEAVARTLKRIAANSYRLDRALREPIDLILATSLENIRTLERQVKKLDQAVLRQLKGINHTLLTIKGIGPVFTAGIIAEVGDTMRFPNQAALAKFAGLCWTKYQSGDFEAQESRLINSGNRYLRYYLIEAANSLKTHDPVFRTYYQRKYAESRKHHHKRALVLAARKLVRLIFSLLKSKKIYQQPEVNSAAA